jgi:uncharacterized SAM-binding protein YcdF (DUF218 family)
MNTRRQANRRDWKPDMFFIVSKIFESLFAPLQFALLLSTAGVVLLFSRCDRYGRNLVAAGVTLLLLMAFSPLGDFLAAPLETRFPPPPANMPEPDGIIVLGGAIDEKLSKKLDRPVLIDSAAERLTAPLALKQKYPNARVIFAGGSAALQGSDFSEADGVRRFWRELGFFSNNIVYEDRSRNTFENAIFARDLAQPKPGESWLLVTSAMHMPRSVGIFRKAGFPVVAFPVDFRTDGEPSVFSAPRFPLRAIGVVQFAIHEWMGLAVYWLTGKTSALFPAP